MHIDLCTVGFMTNKMFSTKEFEVIKKYFEILIIIDKSQAQR